MQLLVHLMMRVHDLVAEMDKIIDDMVIKEGEKDGNI